MEVDHNNVNQHSDKQQEILDSIPTSNSLETKCQKDGRPLREVKELVSKLKTYAGSTEYTDNLKKVLANKLKNL